jgi:hypothetical protein
MNTNQAKQNMSSAISNLVTIICRMEDGRECAEYELVSIDSTIKILQAILNLSNKKFKDNE